MTTPTVLLQLTDPGSGSRSWLAFSERGEILEAVDVDASGSPDWAAASICDARGTGGSAAYEALHAALSAGEANARLVGLEVRRVPDDAS